MRNYLIYRILPIIFYVNGIVAQLNLGSFNLFRNPRGDLQLEFGQGGSLFGYGADRTLQVTIGPGRFGTRTDNGVVLGGERVGVDQQLEVNKDKGLNLGSLLRLGNNGGGDPLGAMLRKIGSFLRLPPPGGVRRAIPPPGPPLPPSGRSGDNGEVPLSVGRGWDGDDDVEPAESSAMTNARRVGSSSREALNAGEMSVEEVPGPLTARRVVAPPAQPVVQPPVRPSVHITTEGSRSGGGLSGSGAESDRRHDNGTGQFERKGKLPIPDGLEMISAISGESRKHA